MWLNVHLLIETSIVFLIRQCMCSYLCEQSILIPCKARPLGCGGGMVESALFSVLYTRDMWAINQPSFLCNYSVMMSTRSIQCSSQTTQASCLSHCHLWICTCSGMSLVFFGPNHSKTCAGYPTFKGQVLNGEQLWELVEGLEANNLLYYTHLLTGILEAYKNCDSVVVISSFVILQSQSLDYFQLHDRFCLQKRQFCKLTGNMILILPNIYYLFISSGKHRNSSQAAFRKLFRNGNLETCPEIRFGRFCNFWKVRKHVSKLKSHSRKKKDGNFFKTLKFLIRFILFFSSLDCCWSLRVPVSLIL